MSELFSEDEAFGRLALQNPVSSARLEQAVHSYVARSGLESILAAAPTRRWWRRRRIVVPIVIAVAAAATATTYAFTRTVSNPEAVACYQGASLNSPARIVALNSSPLASCAAEWASGGLGPALHQPLVVCVRISGAAVVFPSRNAGICQALGLASPTAPTLTAPAQQIEQLVAILGDDAARTACISLDLGSEDAHAAIVEVGLDRWSVDHVGRFTTSQPCATFSVDVAKRTVALIPVPAPSPSRSP